MQKSLDQKLARILANPSSTDFILADAKDADMAFGLSAPGRSPEHHSQEGRFRTLDEYRQLMREIVAQGYVDIMLMEPLERSAHDPRTALRQPHHARRAGKRHDRHLLAGGQVAYSGQPSMPFRSATIDHIMCGKVQCEPHERKLGRSGSYSSRSTTTRCWITSRWKPIGRSA